MTRKTYSTSYKVFLRLLSVITGQQLRYNFLKSCMPPVCSFLLRPAWRLLDGEIYFRGTRFVSKPIGRASQPLMCPPISYQLLTSPLSAADGYPNCLHDVCIIIAVQLSCSKHILYCPTKFIWIIRRYNKSPGRCFNYHHVFPAGTACNHFFPAF